MTIKTSVPAALLLGLPRSAKRFVAASVDTGLCVLTLCIAYYLRLGEFVPLSGMSLWPVCISISLALPIFVLSGLYRSIFRFSGWLALLAVGRAGSIYGFLFACVFTIVGVDAVPRTVGIIQPILLLLFVGISRVFACIWLGGLYRGILKNSSIPKILIYGSGNAGRQLAAAIANSREMQVAGFLDDDDRLQGRLLNGVPVYNPVELSNLVSTLMISDVVLAIPSLSRRRRNEILAKIRLVKVSVRVLPSVTDLARGTVSIADLREPTIEDLLGREPVMADNILLPMKVRSRVVMVTGAGGSIGGELCRQILKIKASKLLLIEKTEFALYRIHQELQERLGGSDTVLVPLLASVQDTERMGHIMSTWHPDTVYHAAAYKHVTLVEHNPTEGIKNNVLGTLKTAQLAIENGVSDFVLISTDKAVRPTNIMGASKRLSELVLQAIAATNPSTIFSIVRFGNVLGSSGSVVPKFWQQVRGNGPITVTHPEVTRYFMTVHEAAELVIQAGALAKGGDLFVLDMGQPVKIMELARRMIELSGLTVKDERNPDGDVKIEITGLRPGEKLHEELLIGEVTEPTSHPRIKRAREEFVPWAKLEGNLKSLEMVLNVSDIEGIRSMMKGLVVGYMPSDEIMDWVYREKEALASYNL